jgi:hypothetical protein
MRKARIACNLRFPLGRPDNLRLAGIEMVHMMRKHQGRFAFNPASSLKEQFEAIAA